MSLPDIEAYIDQKIPTAHVEPELLVSLPRPERAKVEGETESVSAIFKEAREFQDAQAAKQGQGKGHGKGDGTGDKRRPRRRKPRTEDGATASTTPSVAAPTHTGEVIAKDEVRSKRRRRRKPKRPHEATVATDAPAQKASAPAPAPDTSKKPGFVTRVSNKLKNLFGGKAT